MAKQFSMVQRKQDYKMREPQEEIYIALEGIDLSWLVGDLEQVRKWWAEGLTINEMADRLERNPDDVLVLIIDLASLGKIKLRKNGLLGK